LLHRICPLVTQSGHRDLGHLGERRATGRRPVRRPKAQLPPRQTAL